GHEVCRRDVYRRVETLHSIVEEERLAVETRRGLLATEGLRKRARDLGKRNALVLQKAGPEIVGFQVRLENRERYAALLYGLRSGLKRGRERGQCTGHEQVLHEVASPSRHSAPPLVGCCDSIR